MSTGSSDKRQTAGHNDRQSNPYETAELDVFAVAIAHAEVHTSGTCSGKEANDHPDQTHEADDRLARLSRRVVTGAADVGETGIHDHDQRNNRQERGDFAHVLNPSKRHENSECSPDNRYDRERGAASELSRRRIHGSRLAGRLQNEVC